MKWRSLAELDSETDQRSLAQVFSERKELIAKYVSAEVQAIHARTVDALKSKALTANAVGVRTQAPSFELPDQNGKLVSSAVLLSKGPLVVCFIRGRWCPFCVGQMEAMSSIAPKIKTAGASLVAISPQTEKQAYFMHDQHKLQFPLLVDAHNALARQFGLVYCVPEEQQAIYQRTFVNLPFVNGDDSWELPIPATYVIDVNGRVVDASLNEDYTKRPEPLEILSQLEGTP